MTRESSGEEPSADGLTYAAAGVDIAAGEHAVELIKKHAESTTRPGVMGSLGGFGGLFDLAAVEMDDPILVSSTDGVGTKSVLAWTTGRYDTIGIDLVGTADDIAAQGATPLFFFDYLSMGRLEPDIAATIVRGIALGCRQAGCALLGGEMSEHSDLMAPGEFDLVGFAVGAVERDQVLPREVGPGDVLVGIESPGLRCNGYTLARRALLERAGRSLDEPAWAGSSTSLADELLRPSVIYAPTLAELRAATDVHAFAHITGGGLPGNVNRVLPPDTDARITRGSWREPEIFGEVQRAGNVARTEMESVFNLGVGMVAVVAAADAARAVEVVHAASLDAWVIGDIAPGTGAVRLSE
ncbi:MAG: phosphoribosylformylglycinamidine cyclo-ligase [Acidimicrobiia bacterium]|nr:phosphoribosylformylglycinamidine cyclo-ligase [Acidimicrobiia bacterium]